MTPDGHFDLDGKVALVTGASRGIGAEIARLLAAHGAHVVVSSRKPADCETVAHAIREAGGRASVRGCHIGDLVQISETLDWVAAELGTLDILVNNAAANPYFGHVADTPADAFQKTVDVNIRGTFFATAGAAKLMAGRGAGSIVNVASVSAVVPGPLQGVYSITKAAIVSMTKVFAAECGEMGVRVNAILPGITDTRFAAALVHSDAMLARYLPRLPLGRVAQPSEIAGAALYLASPASSYTTGACLVVDGGHLVM